MSQAHSQLILNDINAQVVSVAFRRESNGKKKGEGNAKCGNKHLAWAFVEAAHFAVRYDEQIKRWYQKKAAKTLQVVAIKAVAHKLARACYHILKTGEVFDVTRAFS
jgi:transposase